MYRENSTRLGAYYKYPPRRPNHSSPGQARWSTQRSHPAPQCITGAMESPTLPEMHGSESRRIAPIPFGEVETTSSATAGNNTKTKTKTATWPDQRGFGRAREAQGCEAPDAKPTCTAPRNLQHRPGTPRQELLPPTRQLPRGQSPRPITPRSPLRSGTLPFPRPRARR